MVRKRKLMLLLLLPLLLLLSGCPKDPYRASIQGSKDVADGVAAAIKITASYYSAGTIDDAKKSQVANFLSVVTDCNIKFRVAVTAVHNSGAVGVQAFLPVADSFVTCAEAQRSVMSDPKIYNILKAVDTAINGVSLAVASAKAK